MTNAVTHSQTQKHIAIIGAGLSGVCTAYFLAQAGFQVTVLERRANVAEEATLGNSGLLAPCAAHPLHFPSMFRTTLVNRFQQEPAVLVKSGLHPARWRWMYQSRRAFKENFIDNKQQLLRLATYGQKLTLQLQKHYALEHENSQGLLHLFRHQAETDQHAVLQENLKQCELPRQTIDPKAISQIEPAFQSDTPLSSAIYYPQDQAGNCVLFVKQLKTIAQSLGVTFHFSQHVDAIQPQTNGSVSLQIGNQTTTFDTVVLAANNQSIPLLKPLGINLPLYPVQSYSTVATVKNPDETPHISLFDESYQVAIVRTGNRIRLSGLLGFRPKTEPPHRKAIRSLLKIANDYYPNAANFNIAPFSSNTFALQPNGMPLLGATMYDTIMLNTGHGANGWATAVGAAKLLADNMAGIESEIDYTSLMLAPAKQ